MRASSPISLLAIGSLALIVAVACRVLIPYYQTQQDDPIQTESRTQVRTLMTAINRFVEENPNHKFPSNVTEITPLIASTNVQAIYSRFVYLPPPSHASESDLSGRVVLIEKLGHYKYRVGGYHGMAGETAVGWYSMRDYKTLAENNGLSIEQLSEHQK
jgi:hypothetical protein